MAITTGYQQIADRIATDIGGLSEARNAAQQYCLELVEGAADLNIHYTIDELHIRTGAFYDGFKTALGIIQS